MRKNIESQKNYALEVINYTKTFGKFVAVKNASLGLKHGKIHGFIGPNGAGKTTTIKAIIGAYSSNENNAKIFVEGFKAGTTKAKEKIGYIPERASFTIGFNCLEYLTMMGELVGFKYSKARKKALEILKELKLEKHKYRKPSAFSSGIKKKILIAQALLKNPSILILDEPAANLDPTARKEMFRMFKRVNKLGCSIFISSHILSELQEIIEEVTFISQGEIKYSGNISSLSNINGLIVTFTSINQEIKEFMKNKKGTPTTSGWKILTKSKEETKKLIIEIVNSSFPISTISYLSSSLSAAYDALVDKFEKESKEKGA